MKKLLITLSISLISIAIFAQDNFSRKYSFMYEAEVGVAKYDVIQSPLTSFQMRFGSVRGDYISMGMLLNGYTATGVAYRTRDSYEFLPQGGRVGFFLRATSSSENHLYAEIKGIVGLIFETGLDMPLVGEDQALEYSGGVDMGYNIAFANRSYFGFYLGVDVGNFKFIETQITENMIRYNFGLRFQIRH